MINYNAPRKVNEEDFKEIMELQKKTLKKLHNVVKQQDKEIKTVRRINNRMFRLFQRVKSSVSEPNWKYLTNNQIQKKMEKINEEIKNIEEKEKIMEEEKDYELEYADEYHELYMLGLLPKEESEVNNENI